jgi:hypothetical protein
MIEEQTLLKRMYTRLNLIDVLKDKEVTHKAGISRILGKLTPEMAAPL